jgi:pyruvate/2-oxoglutarate dehydrogenase complex dihydrolipoamide dehydrogenase (E3) component
MNTQHFDALIIGFGKGGKTLAAFIARQDMKVAMVEQ